MVVKPQSRGPRNQGIANDGEKRPQFGLQLCPRCDFGGSGVQKATKVFEIAVVKVLNSATSNGQTRIKTVVGGNTWATNWVSLAHRCRETFVWTCLHCPRPREITVTDADLSLAEFWLPRTKFKIICKCGHVTVYCWITFECVWPTTWCWNVSNGVEKWLKTNVKQRRGQNATLEHADGIVERFG